MKKSILVGGLLAFLFFNTWVQADSRGEVSDSGDDSAELQDLLAILDAQTKIATKTKMNADYVPGLVTVLYGDELEALGVRTVWEALRLVPGIEPSHDQIGGRQTLVRGVGGAFASGNMKILLNNHSMNSALSANANPVLNMAVEQVERVEVIRGPGSAIHGEFAYAGVINVVTRREEKALFVRAGEFDTYTLGGINYWESDDGKSGGSVNLAGWHSGGASVSSGEDALYNGANASQSGLSNAPGPVNDELQQGSLLFEWHRNTFSFSATYVEDGNGDHFGTINVLSPPEGGIDYYNRYFMLNGKNNWAIAESLDVELRLGWQYYENEFDIRVLPDGFVWFNAVPALTLLPDGYISKGYYDEQRLSAEFDLYWEGWQNQKWLVGIGVTRISVGDAWQENNIDPVTLNPFPSPQHLTQADGLGWVAGDRSREILSLTLQDEYRASDIFTLTAGLRYDDYDDVGSNLSPRLAAVWRFNRQHILKAQYAEAFRPPTFYETVWNSDISPETIHTAEFAYIYKTSDSELHVTAFRSKLKELIVSTGVLGFKNIEGVDADGVELELERRLTAKTKLNANFTLVDTKQIDTGLSVAGAADRLANLVWVYQPASTRTYSLWFRYVGDRARESGDTRSDLSSYETVDATATFNSVGYKGLTLRVGVSNLLDEDIRYPAFMTLDLIGAPINSYAGDYPQPSRSVWLQFSYRF